MTVIGGSAKPVHILQASDLEENGGNFKVIGRVALRVYGDDAKVAEGDTLQPIYILSDAELEENGGNFKVIGNQAIPLSKISTSEVKGRVAIPVFLENPSWIDTGLDWLIHDQFLTDLPVGSVDGTDAEPGPGVRDAVNNLASISSSELSVNTDIIHYNWQSFARSSGRFLIVESSPTSINNAIMCAWMSDTLGVGRIIGVQPITATQVFVTTFGVTFRYRMYHPATTITHYAISLRGDSGGYVMCRAGGVWRVVWAIRQDRGNTLTFTPVYAGNIRHTTGTFLVDNVGAIDLATPWNDDNTLQTDNQTTIVNNTTFNHNADAIIVMDMTTNPTTTMRIHFRKQDANNYWEVSYSSGFILEINEIVGGVSTNRASVFGNRVRFDTLIITLEDEVIWVTRYNITDLGTALTYTSATNFKTETNGELFDTGGSNINYIETYQRFLTPAQSTAIEEVVSEL